MTSDNCGKILHTQIFVKIVNDFPLPTIFPKRPILDVRQGFEYASVYIFRESSIRTLNFSIYTYEVVYLYHKPFNYSHARVSL